jgi:hypothetical protein
MADQLRCGSLYHRPAAWNDTEAWVWAGGAWTEINHTEAAHNASLLSIEEFGAAFPDADLQALASSGPNAG